MSSVDWLGCCVNGNGSSVEGRLSLCIVTNCSTQLMMTGVGATGQQSLRQDTVGFLSTGMKVIVLKLELRRDVGDVSYE